MAWRPYENLIDGELDNRIPGRVKGWMRFFRRGKPPLRVTLDLAGDFHEDVRGKVIRLHNDHPLDRNEELGMKGTYMEGFASMQRGQAGDITVGLSLGPWSEALAQRLMAQLEILWDEHGITGQMRESRRREAAEDMRRHIEAGTQYYPYVDYPYIEWYSDNGRVVLELDPSQVDVVETEEGRSRREKTPKELLEDRRRRDAVFEGFMSRMMKSLSEENRKRGGTGNVTGLVVG
jgi:hypothetical protein